LFGSIGVFIARSHPATPGRAAAGYLISGIALWHVVYQSQIGLGTGFLEETWSRNMLNLMVTPITEVEYIAGVALFGLLKLLIGMTVVVGTALGFYAFDVSHLGLGLIPIVAVLLVIGWVIALFVIGLVLRFGSGAEVLAWGIFFVIMPLSGVFYPVNALPAVLLPIAHVLPTTHAFNAGRTLYATGAMRWGELGWAALGCTVFAGVVLVFLVHMLALFRARGYVSRYTRETEPIGEGSNGHGGVFRRRRSRNEDSWRATADLSAQPLRGGVGFGQQLTHEAVGHDRGRRGRRRLRVYAAGPVDLRVDKKIRNGIAGVGPQRRRRRVVGQEEEAPRAEGVEPGDERTEDQLVPPLERFHLLTDVTRMPSLVTGLDVHEKEIHTPGERAQARVALGGVVGVIPRGHPLDVDDLDAGQNTKATHEVDRRAQRGANAMNGVERRQLDGAPLAPEPDLVGARDDVGHDRP
jgi:ABC-2 type transport system permease protein